MKHIKKINKTALVACVSLCLMGLIATSCRTVDKSVQGIDLVQVSGTVLDVNNEPMESRRGAEDRRGSYGQCRS